MPVCKVPFFQQVPIATGAGALPPSRPLGRMRYKRRSLNSFVPPMNRSDLIAALASKNDLTKVAAGQVLDTLIDTIQTAVKKGDAVQLVGFGTFKASKRAARTGKNPSTGAPIKIAAATVPKFVPGAKFKAVVDPKAAARKAAK